MAREKLGIKRFGEYTPDEQIELMFHWFHYYGKTPISLYELDKFKELMDKDMEFVRRAAIVAWAREEMTQPLVNAMRGDFDKYYEEITEVSTTLEFEDYEERFEKELIAELVKTYNNPQPAVPMDEDQLIGEVCRMLGLDKGETQVIKISAADLMKDVEKEEPILTSEKVHKTYRDCLMKDDELVNGEPNVDFTVGEGVRNTAVFNTERLASHKESILAMIDELPDIEQGPTFLNLCYDKHGRQWTGDHGTMDLLMQLGMATEAIYYPLPREIWPIIGGVPLVMRNHTKDDETLLSHKPKEFKKVKEQVSNGTYRKGAK